MTEKKYMYMWIQHFHIYHQCRNSFPNTNVCSANVEMKEEQECIETKVEMNQQTKTNENNAGGYNSTIYMTLFCFEWQNREWEQWLDDEEKTELWR